METIGPIRPMQELFGRWYVVSHQGLVWSGRRAVCILGPVLACSFESQAEAEKFIAVTFPRAPVVDEPAPAQGLLAKPSEET